MKLSLNRKLLIGVVVSSAIVTVFVTIFQLFQNYKSQIEVTMGKFDTLIHVNRGSLETSLWDLNQPQTDSILKGFISHDTVDFIELEFESTEGKKLINTGTKPNDFLNKSYKLSYNDTTVGFIKFYSDKE